jgi:hypothetical protein
MRNFPRTVKIFISLIIALGLAMFLYLFWGLFSVIAHKQPLPFNYLILLGFCIFTPVVIIAELRPEEFLGRIATIVSFSVIFAAIFFIGKEAAVVIAILRCLTAGIINKMRWYSTLFNISQSILAVGTAGMLFGSIVAGKSLWTLTDARISFFIAAGLYIVLSILLVYSYIRLLESHSNEPVAHFILWRDIKVQTAIFSVFFLVTLYKQSPLILILMLLPSVIIFYIIRNYRKLQTETMKTLEALASGIEQRFGYSDQHTSGVVEYAVKLARKLKLHRSEVEILESAARIHDLGKVSIPDNILQKPGRLTKEEFLIMKTHAAVGSQIASQLSAYRAGVSYIRHHHEWYDGSGYPDGLKGEEIPIGARILTLADCFDAMINDRPYRPALPLEEVLDEMEKGKGTHYDPKLAGIFITMIREEQAQKAKEVLKDAKSGSKGPPGKDEEKAAKKPFPVNPEKPAAREPEKQPVKAPSEKGPSLPRYYPSASTSPPPRERSHAMGSDRSADPASLAGSEAPPARSLSERAPMPTSDRSPSPEKSPPAIHQAGRQSRPGFEAMRGQEAHESPQKGPAPPARPSSFRPDSLERPPEQGAPSKPDAPKKGPAPSAGSPPGRGPAPSEGSRPGRGIAPPARPSIKPDALDNLPLNPYRPGSERIQDKREGS